MTDTSIAIIMEVMGSFAVTDEVWAGEHILPMLIYSVVYTHM